MDETEPLISTRRRPPAATALDPTSDAPPQPHPAAVCACVCVGMTLIVGLLTFVTLTLIRYFPYPPLYKVNTIQLVDFHVDNATVTGTIGATLTLTNVAAGLISIEYGTVGGSVAYRGTILGSVDLNVGIVLGENETWTTGFVMRFGSSLVGDGGGDLVRDLERDHVPLFLTFVSRLKMGRLVLYFPIEKIANCMVDVSANNKIVISRDCRTR